MLYSIQPPSKYSNVNGERPASLIYALKINSDPVSNSHDITAIITNYD